MSRRADTFRGRKPRPPADYRRGDKDQAPDCSAAPIPGRCPASPASAPWHQRERLRRLGHHSPGALLRGSKDRAHQSGGKRHESKDPRDHWAGQAAQHYPGDYRKAHWHDDHQHHQRKRKERPAAALKPEIGHSPVETRASRKLRRVWDLRPETAPQRPRQYPRTSAAQAVPLTMPWLPETSGNIVATSSPMPFG